MDSALATLTQLASSLRLPAEWLEQEALAGRIPCLRLTNTLRFNAHAVAEILASRAAEERLMTNPLYEKARARLVASGCADMKRTMFSLGEAALAFELPADWLEAEALADPKRLPCHVRAAGVLFSLRGLAHALQERDQHERHTRARELGTWQVAERFAKTQRTIRRWADHKGLPHTRDGSHYLFDAWAVQRWACRNKVPTPGEPRGLDTIPYKENADGDQTAQS